MVLSSEELLSVDILIFPFPPWYLLPKVVLAQSPSFFVLLYAWDFQKTWQFQNLKQSSKCSKSLSLAHVILAWHSLYKCGPPHRVSNEVSWLLIVWGLQHAMIFCRNNTLSLSGHYRIEICLEGQVFPPYYFILIDLTLPTTIKCHSELYFSLGQSLETAAESSRWEKLQSPSHQ